jgi:hypothetical protein
MPQPTISGAFGLALVASLSWSLPARAQDTAPRRLTLEEAEAYQMSLEMAFACSPARHRRLEGSESTIRRATDALAGTAAHFHSVDGTFLVLERYGEELDGHCLVLGWFGGPLEPGRYEIDRLAMDAVEAEVATGQYAFFGMSAVRTPDENALLVVESGSLDIATMESGTVEGTFELAGFLVDGAGANRTGAATWAGSFRAVASSAP